MSTNGTGYVCHFLCLERPEPNSACLMAFYGVVHNSPSIKTAARLTFSNRCLSQSSFPSSSLINITPHHSLPIPHLSIHIPPQTEPSGMCGVWADLDLRSGGGAQWGLSTAGSESCDTNVESYQFTSGRSTITPFHPDRFASDPHLCATPSLPDPSTMTLSLLLLPVIRLPTFSFS